MVEKVFWLTQTDEKLIEKVIMDDNLHYMHMVLKKGEALPKHDTNSHVYMTVLRGTLSIELNEKERQTYTKGALLKIPFQTKMNVRNEHDDVLELTVVKAPAPK